MEKLETIAACVVSKCKDEPKVLIMASRDGDVKNFPACERHYQGVHNAVAAKFVPLDYTVVCYTELMGK